jgi:hypothetical protein
MIGLMFLGVALLWLWLTVYLTVKAPRWLGLKSYTSALLRLLLVPLLLVGPFVDEIVGMRQFERICQERAVVWVNPGAEKVTRAREGSERYEDLAGYWVPIRVRKIVFLDADSGEPFVGYEALSTKGGRIARIALLGGEHSCRPPNPNALNDLNIDKLLEQGRKK